MAATAVMTGAEFDQLSYDQGRKFELVRAELIGVASATPEHQLIVCALGSSLLHYMRRTSAGAVLPDSEFALGADTRLRPDLAVLLKDRWALVNRKTTPIPVAPDIAVEVLSPSELATYSLLKVRNYLAAGVREVWQVSAETQQVLVNRDRKSVEVLDLDDRLITPLLPDWEVALREIFESPGA